MPPPPSPPPPSPPSPSPPPPSPPPPSPPPSRPPSPPPPSPPPPTPPPPSPPHHGFAAYDMGDGNAKTWQQAQRFCSMRGGHLAAITSADANEELRRALEIVAAAALLADVGVGAWTGGSYKNSVWQWDSGGTFLPTVSPTHSYSNWAGSQPALHGCVEVESLSGFWFARSCELTDRRFIVCQEVAPPPRPPPAPPPQPPPSPPPPSPPPPSPP
eukprot:922278-Prymnesium_polylepis.1